MLKSLEKLALFGVQLNPLAEIFCLYLQQMRVMLELHKYRVFEDLIITKYLLKIETVLLVILQTALNEISGNL